MDENQHDPGAPADRPRPAEGPADQPAPAGTTTDSGPRDEGPRVTGAEVRDLARLRRSSTDRHVAGVAGGLARHLDIDPVILRVGFVVLAFFGAAGLLLYAALWLLVPEEDSGRATLDVDPRSRSVALVVAGVLAVLIALGDWGGWWFPWPLLLIALLVWLVLSRRDRRPSTPGPAVDPATGRPVPPGAASAADRPPAGTTTMSGWAGDPATAVRTPDPKKRGPVLFWFTVALTALALGTLGIVDLAGAAVVDGAYPALALGIVAAMLLVGAFWGRAGGLILLGLVALVALVGTTAGQRWDGERLSERPASAGEVASEYELHRGELVLDLRGVSDLESLDGRSVDLRVGAGRIELVVPDELAIDFDGSAGVGRVAFGEFERGGFGVELDSGSGGADTVGTLHVEAHIGAGEITVEQR